MGKARNTCKNLALQSDLSRQYHLSLLERLWLVLHVQHVFRALPHLSQRRTGPVFQSRQGGLYSKRRIQQIVREVAKRAGITKRVYPHLLRHTVAQHLADRGMPEELLQKFLGHEKPETTQIYYQPARSRVKHSFKEAMEKRAP